MPMLREDDVLMNTDYIAHANIRHSPYGSQVIVHFADASPVTLEYGLQSKDKAIAFFNKLEKL